MPNNRKVLRNSNKLKDLRTEKKKILEKVMEKETYKVAVEILDKFGDKSHRLQTQAINASLTPLRAPINSPKPIPTGMPRMPVPSIPQSRLSPPSVAVRAPTPVTPQMRPNRPMPVTPQTAPGLIMRHQQQHQMMQSGGQTAYRRTPFPIINHNQKGVFGENGGLSGMALKEEYEYTAFRCAFCGTFNAAKKQRPMAPRLPFEQAQFDRLSQKPESSTASEVEGDDGERSSASSESGEPRSPGVGEEGPVESELEVPQDEARMQQNNSTGESGEGGSETVEKSPSNDESEERTDTKTPTDPAVSDVPSWPETVGSKKMD
ncbi:AGAP007983-PA-like protein [Anopheles sinensis]|uniref:AGAP007983-PA-like protein n=1 Tax=Anopheles sinensis TaxID=74873 RepID=A0A084W5Z4_ANOSI|nr:AGAP007983-PA-like protein [Anopheles sinensis]